MYKTKKALRKSLTLCLLCCLPLLFSACTWVKKKPGAASVRTVPADRVADCQSLGNVTTSTLGNISVVTRNTKKVEKEVETLAKNEAVQSGADTIVAVSKLLNGERTFAMYKCLR